VLAPMPNASVSTTTHVKLGFLVSCRAAKRRSCLSSSNWTHISHTTVRFDARRSDAQEGGQHYTERFDAQARRARGEGAAKATSCVRMWDTESHHRSASANPLGQGEQEVGSAGEGADVS
jgi:hypothetical protein